MGIGFKTSRHSRDVDQVVGLINYQFGIEHPVFFLGPHQIELAVFVEQTVQVAPVPLAVYGVLAGTPVEHLHLLGVFRVGVGVEIGGVPAVHDDPQVFGFQGSPLSLARLGKVYLEQTGNGRLEHQGHKLTHGFPVVQEIGGQCLLVGFLQPTQMHARFVHCGPQCSRCMVLFEQVVGLGKRTTQVDIHRCGALLDTFDEGAAERMVHGGVVGRQFHCPQQLLIIVFSCLWLVYLSENIFLHSVFMICLMQKYKKHL